MKDAYDVIIAGAGPAGAQCARYLTQHSKYSVLLLDKTNQIGEPKKSTAGTLMSTIKHFNLPKKVIMSKTNFLTFEGTKEEAIVPIKGCVMEFGILKKFLVEDAIKYGADLKIKSIVTDVLIENNKAVGAKYKDSEGEHQVKGKIIIDATGPQATLATKIGLRKLNQKYYAQALEFQMERLNLNRQNNLLIKFDTSIAPGGYAWIFSTGKNKAKVGVVVFKAFFHNKGGKYPLIDYLNSWSESDERLKEGISTEEHAGDVYLDPTIRKRSTDNFMMIGDAACCVFPPFAEGIRQALYAGTFAAQTAIKALRKNNTSAKELSNYDKLWNKKFGKYYKINSLLTTYLYSSSNERVNRLIKIGRNVPKAAIRRFLDYKITLSDVRKAAPALISQMFR